MWKEKEKVNEDEHPQTLNPTKEAKVEEKDESRLNLPLIEPNYGDNVDESLLSPMMIKVEKMHFEAKPMARRRRSERISIDLVHLKPIDDTMEAAREKEEFPPPPLAPQATNKRERLSQQLEKKSFSRTEETVDQEKSQAKSSKEEEARKKETKKTDDEIKREEEKRKKEAPKSQITVDMSTFKKSIYAI